MADTCDKANEKKTDISNIVQYSRRSYSQDISVAVGSTARKTRPQCVFLINVTKFTIYNNAQAGRHKFKKK